MKRSSVLTLVATIGLAVIACSGTAKPGTTSPSAPPAGAGEPEVRKISDLPYYTDRAGTQHALTIYAPAAVGGPWPVVVMIHGLGGEELVAQQIGGIAAEPSAVAAEGIVVFVPTWPDPSWVSAEATRAELVATAEQMACAVRFARVEAERHGGDSSNLSVYGESAGALTASILAFANPTVPDGCAAPSGPVVPDNLVLFEGDWLLSFYPRWDELLRGDPGMVETFTPWSYLDQAARMPVHVLDSNDPTLSRTAEDADDWLALRDPTDTFRRDLEEMGAFDDGVVGMRETQGLLYDRLQSLGYEATFHDLPGSTHDHLSDAALQIVVDTILQGT